MSLRKASRFMKLSHGEREKSHEPGNRSPLREPQVRGGGRSVIPRAAGKTQKGVSGRLDSPCDRFLMVASSQLAGMEGSGGSVGEEVMRIHARAFRDPSRGRAESGDGLCHF